jgi:hypothetical protein
MKVYIAIAAAFCAAALPQFVANAQSTPIPTPSPMQVRSVPAVPTFLQPALPVRVSYPSDVLRPGGITVYAMGTSEALAHDVNVVVYVRGGTGTDTEAIAAMRAAGIENPTVTSPSYIVNANSSLALRGTIRNVSHEKLDAIGKAAFAFAIAHPGTNIDSVQFFGTSMDCPAVETQARVAAFAEAQRRARAIAALAGVKIGTPTSVTENGGCITNGQTSNFPVDAVTFLMRVTVNENITYSIVRPGPK